MPPVRLGFRVRVLGSFVLLVAGALVVGLWFQRAVLLERLDRGVDNGLAQERAELEALAGGSDPATGRPFGSDVEAIFETFLATNVPLEGEVIQVYIDGELFGSTPSSAPLDPDGSLAERWSALRSGEFGQLTTVDGPVRYMAVPLQLGASNRGVFVVANFIERERAQIEASARVAATVAGGVLLVASASAWFVAGRLLRPIRHLTEAAEAIDDTRLDRRIPVEGDDEIARLARRFNEMIDRLDGAFSAQRAFIDDAGHELRTPITIIRGHLELMGDDPADRQATITLVTEELDRMARMVGDLLLLAKAQQPDFIRPGWIEIADVTAELFAKSRTLGDRRWCLDAEAVGAVWADRQRLIQALLNLARNAVEHTAPGAEVGIGSSVTNGRARLWVRDTGTGIDPAEHEHIFGRFARGRDGARRSDGAGLGLAIVRSVVEAHGGSVELDSRPGAGARFTIVLDELTTRPDGIDPDGDRESTFDRAPPLAATRGPR